MAEAPVLQAAREQVILVAEAPGSTAEDLAQRAAVTRELLSWFLAKHEADQRRIATLEAEISQRAAASQLAAHTAAAEEKTLILPNRRMAFDAVQAPIMKPTA